MAEKEKSLQLNTSQRNWLFYGSLILLALVAFLFAGSGEPVLFDDSGAYTKIKRVEGVMPLYPLFLLINQCLFGLERYLDVVIVEQAVLAAVCVILFVKTLRDEFHLFYWESYLIFFLSLMPFTTEMPQSMSTQQILTEGLSYALFYLFVIVLLKTVWTKKYEWFMGSLAMAFLLTALRSQLQIMFAVCGVILYMWYADEGRMTKKRMDGSVRWLEWLVGSASALPVFLLRQK